MTTLSGGPVDYVNSNETGNRTHEIIETKPGQLKKLIAVMQENNVKFVDKSDSRGRT